MTLRRFSVTLLAVYGALLLASHIVRRIRPSVPPPNPAVQIQPVGAVRGNRILAARSIQLAYRTFGDSTKPVLVMVHGSPGSGREMQGLGESILGTRYRIIAPDLPGFGQSTHDIPDYSFRAHAHYLLQLLDSLHIADAHFLGFSMGGGVILNITDLAPDRVRSLTMLSALGTQEFELLGDYWMNHGLHGLQLVGLWALREGVPHFGRWDHNFLGVPYARNFFDSDQRPLRPILEHYTKPMLVLQGDVDPLVPKAAALETYRLVPQSEMVMMEGNHFMTFQRPDDLAPAISNFLGRVDGGVAPTRASASVDRVRAAQAPFTGKSIPRASGLAMSILLLLLAAATLVSEDLTSIGAGLLVARGTVSFIPAALACTVGIIIGDLMLFAAGRLVGRPALAMAPFRWFLSEGDVRRASAWFAKKGPWLIVATRFLPGTRLPTYFAAGLLRTRLLLFAGMFVLAALLWTPALVGLSALFGTQIANALETYQTYATRTLIIAALTVIVVLRLLIPLCSTRGRRLLATTWARLTRWEYWPRWALYAPVVPYILWQALRHRSLTLFTSVNPGMPGGGLVGEPKHLILTRLAQAGDAIPPWILLPPSPGDAKDALGDFCEAHHLTWPLVLKPDIGERGSGVQIIRSLEAAERYLERAKGPVMAQAFVPGVEFGVFYYRLPDEPKGTIFSLTGKEFPTVVGDGTSTLEALILNHPTTVGMTRWFLGAHADRLYDVPASGEEVLLAELGTHSRGSIFRDATALRTPALEAEIDRLSQCYDGFYFGRYDVRVPSEEDLQNGTGIHVIELNGAAAEATSMYDPRYSIWSAWRTLIRLWRILYTIAAANQARGHRPDSIGTVLHLLRTHHRAVRGHVSP